MIDSLLFLGVAAAMSSFVPWLLQYVGALGAENLFLRRQLAMYVERGIRPRRPTRRDRLMLVIASKFFAWRDLIVVVRPATLIHRSDRLSEASANHLPPLSSGST